MSAKQTEDSIDNMWLVCLRSFAPVIVTIAYAIVVLPTEPSQPFFELEPYQQLGSVAVPTSLILSTYFFFDGIGADDAKRFVVNVLAATAGVLFVLWLVLAIAHEFLQVMG